MRTTSCAVFFGAMIEYLVLLFAIIGFSSMVLIYSSNDSLRAEVIQKQIMDNALDSATDAALESLVEQSDVDGNYNLNKEKCISTFFQSLSTTLTGIDSDMLYAYVPVCAVLDNDGYYLYYSKQVEEDGVYKVTRLWTEKRPYTYTDGNWVYSFTLGDTMTVVNSSTGSIYSGTREDLVDDGVTGIVQEEESFSTAREQAIIELLQSEFQAIMNLHNSIAQKLGVSYDFQLPAVEDSTWSRAIKDVSFITFFQGYSYGEDSDDVYNRYSFGGARLLKKSTYYLQPVNGVLYYHKDGCSLLTDYTQGYTSRKACALQGGMPCTECNP